MANPDQSPSIQEWKDLYDAAIEFKKLAPWEWMYDSDQFGVQDPVSGEIGYCCIMGNLGEHFALAVYLGTEGLDGLLRIQSGEAPSTPGDFLYMQKCLMASFEDRKYIEKQDMEIIKSLGLKFRGSNSWPLFRSYLPGYHPWYLTRDEAKFLTAALHQAMDVALRFKDDPDILEPPKKDHYLVRVPVKKDGEIMWKDEWKKPLPFKKTEFVTAPVDEKRLKKVAALPKKRGGTWEIDFFYTPTGVKEEGERPYYPILFLYVDSASGIAMNFNLVKPPDMSGFPGLFLDFVENAKILPKEILVSKEETYKLLEYVAPGLGVKLRLVKNLPRIEEAREFFETSFMKLP